MLRAAKYITRFIYFNSLFLPSSTNIATEFQACFCRRVESRRGRISAIEVSNAILFDNLGDGVLSDYIAVNFSFFIS